MTWVEIVLSLAKIAVVVLFLLNAAAVATWADRRQSAMVQDRIGPNRATIYLPSNLVRVIVLLPPSLFGLLAFFAARRPLPPRAAVQGATLGIQLSILVAWLGLLLLCSVVRRSGPVNKAEEELEHVDPRTIFYGGLGLHALGFIAGRVIAPDLAPAVAQGAGWMLAGLLFLVAIYAASRVPEGAVPVRLAGTLHAVADAIKLFVKEDFIPPRADRLLHALAPMIALFPALVTFAIIPFGDTLCFADNGDGKFDFGDLSRLMPTMTREYTCRGHSVHLQIADLNVGILYLFAMAGTGVIGAAIAGWASDNKFSLLGGLRAASQMVSYEVAMGLSLVGVFLVYGAVRLGPMVDWQGENAWGVFVQPVAFVLFLTALAAEGKRVPFDQPEGESEIVAGYFVEYSGFKFGMFFTGEYLELITSSALLVTLFFGGYELPFLHRDGVTVAFGDTTLFRYPMTHLSVSVIYVLAFFGKTLLMSWLQIFFRWTLPRFRYDQLMKLGWTKLLPFSLANLLVTGVVLLAIEGRPAIASTLKIAGDVSQAVVAFGLIAGMVAIIVGLLEPVERRRFLKSTSARFAAAAGGTKVGPQQA
jgi:NADH-quinone oxidoreductase subunit H